MSLEARARRGRRTAERGESLVVLLVALAITVVAVLGMIELLTVGVLTGEYGRNRIDAHTAAVALLEQRGYDTATTDGSDTVLYNGATGAISVYSGGPVPSGSTLVRRTWRVVTSAGFRCLEVSTQAVSESGQPLRGWGRDPVVLSRLMGV